MHHKMFFNKLEIQNKKLAVLSFLLIALFITLGIWQLSRANDKKWLIKSYVARVHQSPLKAQDLVLHNDYRFYQAELEGFFDNDHTLLLDNKIFHHKVGYEVYTPFKIKGLHKVILVDRGFIPIGLSRDVLPNIRAIPNAVTITGLLNLPPRYAALGSMQASSLMAWPLRIEFVNISQLKKYLPYSLFPYTLTLPPNHHYGYLTEWQIVIMPPEKHMAYAIQWFALAATLLILFAVLNHKKKSRG
jgi:surfeit locus 1 family protein